MLLVKYYFLFLIFLYFLYISGVGLLSVFKYRGFKSLFIFIPLFISLILFNVIFSLSYTSFIGSFNLILLILILYWLYVYRNQDIQVKIFPSNSSLNRQSFIVLFVVATIAFVINVFLKKAFVDSVFFNVTKDDIFYSLVNNFIKDKHVESTSIDWYYYNGKINLRPYHYFEQWTSLFFVKLGVSSLHSMHLIVAPIFYVITIFGIQSLFSININRNKYFEIALAVMICFIGFYGVDFKDSNVFISGPLPLGFKYQVLFWGAFIIVHLIKFRNWNWMFAFFSMFPLLNYGLYPMLLIILLLYLFLYSKLFNKKTDRFVVFSMLIVLLGIPILKLITNSSMFNGQYDQKISEIFLYYNSGQFFLKFKLIFTMGLYYLWKKVQENFGIILLIIFFIFYLIKFKNIHFNDESKSVLRLFTIILLSSVAFSSVLNFMLDANQVFSMTFQIILGCVFVYCFIVLAGLIEKNACRYLLASLLFAFFCLNLFYKRNSKDYEIFTYYNSLYRNKIVCEFNKRDTGRQLNGVRYMSNEYYKSIYQIQSTDQFEGFIFTFLSDKLHLYTINPENVLSNDSDPLGIYDFAFDRYSSIEYYNNWAKERGFNILEKNSGLNCQLKFISEFSVDFIVAQKGVNVPDQIMKLVDKEVVSDVNGERVYFINKKLLSSIR